MLNITVTDISEVTTQQQLAVWLEFHHPSQSLLFTSMAGESGGSPRVFPRESPSTVNKTTTPS